MKPFPRTAIRTGRILRPARLSVSKERGARSREQEFLLPAPCSVLPANWEEPDDGSELDDEFEPPQIDDGRWDVFIPDDDERDPLPHPGDFWMEEPSE